MVMLAFRKELVAGRMEDSYQESSREAIVVFQLGSRVQENGGRDGRQRPNLKAVQGGHVQSMLRGPRASQVSSDCCTIHL